MTTKTVFSSVVIPVVLVVATVGVVFSRRQIQRTKESVRKRSSSTSTQTTTQKNVRVSSEIPKESIRIILQRFRKASLLVDGKVEYVGGGIEDLVEPSMPSDTSCGLLVYISFAKSATKEKALQAAKTVLNLPLLTQGTWGDGSDTKSFLAMTSHCKPQFMLVPQANLISKVKSQGKSIQYHGQIGKEMGMTLYNYFLDCIRALVLEHQFGAQKKPLPEWTKQYLSSKQSTLDIRTPPHKMFQDNSLYSAWDEYGIPLKTTNGDELTKSAIKKMKKKYETQKKRYEKYLNSPPNMIETDKKDWSLLDSSFCTILAGTFGARQALSISSDMGPFCHVVSL